MPADATGKLGCQWIDAKGSITLGTGLDAEALAAKPASGITLG